MSDNKHYDIHLLSNSHWDREWYMSHEKYLARLVPLMDRLVTIMKTQPDYIFVMDGQYAMLEDYLAIRPEMTDTVKGFMAEGRLKVGPWYTQPLETLISGEAMIRNLQHGIAETQKLGPVMRVSYEVDEFGHASQTPQILSGFGISGAIAWRGLPKNSRSAVKWKSPDGSAITMFYSNDGYGEATALPLCEDDYVETIDGHDIKRAGLRSRVESLRRLREANADTTHLLWLNGIDHSWAQPDILSVIERVNALYPDLTVKQDTPEGFTEAVLADYAARDLAMTEVEGELMFTREDVLESTHSCHPVQKKANYDTENMLEHTLEPLCTLAWLQGEDYPEWAVKRAWRYVLENHAHDSLGCTSVDEVFEEVMTRYRCAYSLAEQTVQESVRGLMAHGKGTPSVYLFNKTSAPIRGVVPFSFDIPEGMGKADFYLTDKDGNVVPHVLLEKDNVLDVRYNPRFGHPTRMGATYVSGLLFIDNIPALGYVRLNLASGDPISRVKRNLEPYYFVSAPGVMENDHLRVTINQNGTFDLLDKATGHLYPSQLLWEDSGDADNCYIHQTPFNDRRTYLSTANAASVRQLYDTPLGAAFEIVQTLTIPDGLKDNRTRRADLVGTVDITAVVTLHKDARRVDLKVTVNNHARNHRLRALFPTNLSEATHSRSGQPFDTVSRPIRREFDLDVYEQPYATSPMQDFCDVTGDSCGLTVAAAGIYEYECTDNAARALALTVLRANEMIDVWAFSNPRYTMHKGQVLDTPLTYTLALIPHGADPAEARNDVTAALLSPMVLLNRQSEVSVMTDYESPARDLDDIGSALALESDGNVVITAFKKAYDRDTLIVRLHNAGKTTATGSLKVGTALKAPAAAYETTLGEDRTRPLTLTDETVAFELRPAGLLTLEFEMTHR
jgi:alpha-mannosidase